MFERLAENCEAVDIPLLSLALAMVFSADLPVCFLPGLSVEGGELLVESVLLAFIWTPGTLT